MDVKTLSTLSPISIHAPREGCDKQICKHYERS